MSKNRSRRKPTPKTQETAAPVVDHSQTIATCQRILRSLTGVMIGAFVLIVILTTISVGNAVQILGRGLYYMILASAVISLGVWAARVRLERHMGKNGPAVAEVIKRA